MATQTTTSGNGKDPVDGGVTADDLKRDFERLRGDMAKMAEQMADLSREKVREKKDEVSRRAGENYDAGRNWLSDQMTERPVASLGVAVLAGVLIGRAMKR